MVSPAKIAEKLIGSVVKGSLKEGKIEDGTLDGPAAQKDKVERGIKEAKEIEKREKASRTA